ncbi:MAG: AsmA family protein [Burkholderiaceae bacterium]|nr:AsmA family protein [Burkholderiaceae bacterium]
MTETRSSGRWWRFAAIVLAALLLAGTAAWFALVRLYPPARLAALLGAEVQAATGRELRIAGALSIRLLPRIAVVAEDVRLGNADWGSQPEMVRLERAAFEVALRPLLQGRIGILQVQVQGAQLLLESDGQGRLNWQFTPPAAQRPPPSPAGHTADTVVLERLLATDTRISLRDGGSGRTHGVAIAALDLRAQGDRDQLTATLDPGGVAWQVQARIGHLLDLTRGDGDWPFTLRASAPGAELAAEGHVGTGARAGQGRADVRLQVDDTAPLLPLAPALARLPLPLRLQASVEGRREALRVDALRLSLAGQAITGQLVLRGGGDPPGLSGSLHADELDLGRLPTATAAAAGHPATVERDQPLFGDEPLPFADLASLPAADLAVRIDSLVWPGLPPLTGLSGQLATAPGRLAIDRLAVAVLGGQVSGQFEAQLPAAGSAARGTPGAPSTRLRVDAHGLSIDALKASTAVLQRLKGGRADLEADLRLSGSTPRSLAASASGGLLLQLGGATLSGTAAALERNPLATLLDALLPRRAADGDITIGCAVLRLPLTQGVARIDRSIALETGQLAISASGQLDLREQTVALAFHPQVKKGLGLSPANLAQLVTLQGPLLAPDVAIDPKGTAREAVTVGAAVATGGLTLLAGRLRDAPADGQACRTALGGSAEATKRR